MYHYREEMQFFLPLAATNKSPLPPKHNHEDTKKHKKLRPVRDFRIIKQVSTKKSTFSNNQSV
jgi:hypothetical protein